LRAAGGVAGNDPRQLVSQVAGAPEVAGTGRTGLGRLPIAIFRI
jgi:hypothetical protein